MRLLFSPFKDLPKASDGLPNYFKAVFAIARKEQLALAEEYPDPAEYGERLTALIDRVFAETFSFGIVGEVDVYTGSAPNLMAVHRFISDLFLPGGPFHRGVASKISFQPNQILWAPLAHLIISHPEETGQLNQAIWFRVAVGYMTRSPQAFRQRFERDLNLLGNRIGLIDHQPWAHDLVQNLPGRVRSFEDLSEIFHTVGLKGLLEWQVDLNALMLSGVGAFEQEPLGYFGYGRLIFAFLGLLAQVEQNGSIDPTIARQWRGILLQVGLNSWRMQNKWNEQDWRRCLDAVFEFTYIDFTPAQWVSYLHFATTTEQWALATRVLQQFQPTEVLEAILDARKSCAETVLVRLTRELGLEDQFPKNDWLGLLGSAFSNDLGL
jgi:hypothetical protein